jgi:hypothetical protein
MLKTTTIIRLTLAALLAGASAQVLALPATCASLGIENNVAANAGCQIGTTNNDTNGGSLRVNADSMFGFTDWIFAEKAFESEQSIDVDLFVFGNAKGGFWFINDDVWDTYSDVMLVLKGGNGSTNLTSYVGYLLESGQDSGSYLSPFMNGRNRKDISHISVYLRGASAVAEPTTLVLVGIGLVGIAGLRRRRS